FGIQVQQLQPRGAQYVNNQTRNGQTVSSRSFHLSAVMLHIAGIFQVQTAKKKGWQPELLIIYIIIDVYILY
ncbi:hypothetical protein ACJX0J_007326, partial [Zea mays]